LNSATSGKKMCPRKVQKRGARGASKFARPSADLHFAKKKSIPRNLSRGEKEGWDARNDSENTVWGKKKRVEWKVGAKDTGDTRLKGNQQWEIGEGTNSTKTGGGGRGNFFEGKARCESAALRKGAGKKGGTLRGGIPRDRFVKEGLPHINSLLVCTSQGGEASPKKWRGFGE